MRMRASRPVAFSRPRVLGRGSAWQKWIRGGSKGLNLALHAALHAAHLKLHAAIWHEKSGGSKCEMKRREIISSRAILDQNSTIQNP